MCCVYIVISCSVSVWFFLGVGEFSVLMFSIVYSLLWELWMGLVV